MTDTLAVRQSPRMHSIEGARGIAALIVALMHCGHLMRVDQFSGHVGLGGFFDFGYVGVDFFFVLSGFIITYVHYADMGRPHRLGVYLWRRLTRIFPIYWFCLALTVATIFCGRILLGKAGSLDFSASDIPGTLLLLRTGEPKFLGIAWSLQFELLFYVAFCVLLLHRRLGIGAILLWASAIILRLLSGHVGDLAGVLSASSLQFIMGIGIGFLARSPSFFRPGKLALLSAVSLFAVATFLETHVFPEHSDAGRILLGAASASILWSLVELEKQSRLRTPHLLATFGSVSYSVYLMHILFINLTFNVLSKTGLYPRLPEAVVFAIGLVGGLAVATSVGLYIELPMVAWLKRQFGHTKAVNS